MLFRSAQASGVGYGPRYLAQTREGIGVLTGSSERAVQPCSGVGGEVRRRRVRRIPWSGRGGAAPGVLIPRTGVRSGCGGEHGVRGARASPGASYCSEAASPAAAGFGCDSGVAEVGAEEVRLGKLLGVTTDLLRGFAGAGMQLGGGFTVAQSPARQRSARRGRAGFWRRL